MTKQTPITVRAGTDGRKRKRERVILLAAISSSSLYYWATTECYYYSTPSQDREKEREREREQERETQFLAGPLIGYNTRGRRHSTRNNHLSNSPVFFSILAPLVDRLMVQPLVRDYISSQARVMLDIY
jgi:hypothetical protein